MRRLFIVEDEAIVRDWLVHTMHWEILGFSVAGEAQNGLDALRFLEKNPVDAVITDIRMPDMDGLEMMGMLKVRRPELPVIILSGYNSFEHARKAIQLGAFEFLSKPLDEEELAETMARLALFLSERDQRQESERTLRSMWTTSLFSQDLTDQEQRETLEHLLPGMAVDSACVVIAAVDSEASQQEIRRIFREAGVFRNTQLAVTFRDGRFYLLICTASALRHDDFMAIAHNLYHAMHEALGKDLGSGRYAITMVVGGLMQDLSTLGAWTRTAEEALEATFFQGRGQLLDAARLLASVRRPTPDTDLLARIATLAQGAIEACMQADGTQAGRDMAELFPLLPEAYGGAPDQCRFAILEWLILLASRMREHGLYLGEEESKVRLHQALFALHTLGAVRSFVWAYGARAVEQIRAHRAAQQQNISSKATAYILENIEQKLSLEEIAGALFLNPAYLSSTFKRETGVAMMRFINHEKVERAKRMLLEQRMSTQQIADRLGFGTSRYFSSVFKKETGLTPGGFRKRNGQGI